MDKRVDVVVLEKEPLQIYESLELGNVRGADDVVESDILERDLHHGLLELLVVEDFESISVDEQKLVALNFSVTGLYKAVVPALLSSLVAVQSKRDNSVHFVFPFLADDVEETFGTNVFVGLRVWALGLILSRDMFFAGRQICGRRRFPSSCFETVSLGRGLLRLVELGGHAVVVAHLLSYLHHIQILERRAVLDAELEVALLVCDGVAVESQLRHLVGILDRGDIVEFFDNVVR